ARQLDAALATAAAQHADLFSATWPQWSRRPLGTRPPPKPRRSTRGRKPHDDLFLARVAKDYVDAVKQGKNPVQYVAKVHVNGGDEEVRRAVAKVRGWVNKARERGFLVRMGPHRSRQGQAGGVLSPTAELVLATHRTDAGTT